MRGLNFSGLVPLLTALYFIWKSLTLLPFAGPTGFEGIFFLHLRSAAARAALCYTLCPLMLTGAALLFWERTRRLGYFLLWAAHLLTYWPSVANRSPEIAPLGFLLFMNFIYPAEDAADEETRWFGQTLMLGNYYAAAAWIKLQDPAWVEGRGLLRLLDFPGIRWPEPLTWLAQFPPALAFVNGAVLLVYLTFWAGAFYRPYFVATNLFLLAMHFSLLFLARLEQLSWAMVLLHFAALVSFWRGGSAGILKWPLARTRSGRQAAA